MQDMRVLSSVEHHNAARAFSLQPQTVQCAEPIRATPAQSTACSACGTRDETCFRAALCHGTDAHRCDACAAQHAPQRYYACVCCRMPRAYRSACIVCLRWLLSHNEPHALRWLDAASAMLRAGDFLRPADLDPAWPWLADVYPRIRRCPGFYILNRCWQQEVPQ